MKDIVVAIVKKAGDIILEEMGRATFAQKGPYDILASADIASERYILKEIRKNFSTHNILSEEAGGSWNADGYLWIIDPLDGTVNFSQKLPDFCISVALMHANKTILGVIYQPLLNDLYVAEAGKGCTLNGTRVHVTQKKALREMVGATECCAKKAPRIKNFKVLVAMGGMVRDIRISGSTALNLARVAAGQYDFYFNNRLNVWDVAAGFLLIEEAGGIVTDLAGKQISMNSKNSVTSNTFVHEKFRRILSSVDI